MIAHGFTGTSTSISHADGFVPSSGGQVLVQPWSQSQQLALPADPATPVIVISADEAGIPAFRSILERRKATGAMGEHWLLLGDRPRPGNGETVLNDTLLNEYARDGTLSHLDAAARGERENTGGIEDRMFEHGRGLWAWIDLGACLYVFGSPTQVAEIETALKELIAEQGRMPDDHAVDFLAQMAGERRYQRSFN